MTRPYYITTPIYYVNDSPHIGHAYTTIACDVVARAMKLSDYDVKFLTGTDEHGQKVDKSAKAKGVDPQAFTDEVSERFRALVDSQRGEGENLLNISNTDFIRTTEPRHKKAAQEFWKAIQKNSPDAIYKANYGGWYSVRDEAYYQENELVEKEGKKVAPTGADVEWVEEESYFFKLSDYGDRILAWLDTNPDVIYPKSRFNEVRSFVAGGLKDLSISRTTFDWGIKVPGDEKHIMYVWIDALTNYLTSCGYPQTDKYWNEVTHVVGKDILRFHAVYWPAFLMAANVELPKKIIAHGWWTIEGEKMSKSLGNVLAPADMIARAGSIDALRWFLLRAMPFGNDGDFSQNRMIEVINSDLANTIGNLAQRTLSMIQKNCDGKIPAFVTGKLEKEDGVLLELFQVTSSKTKAEVEEKYRNCRFNEIMGEIGAMAMKANEYIDAQAPWKLKKENPERMDAVLYCLAEGIRCMAIYLQPFMPASSTKLLDQLTVPANERSFAHATPEYALKPGTVLPAPQGVFPRIDITSEAA